MVIPQPAEELAVSSRAALEISHVEMSLSSEDPQSAFLVDKRKLFHTMLVKILFAPSMLVSAEAVIPPSSSLRRS